MAEGTKLEIVSPERLLLSETVRSVTVPGTDGYFTVLGDHAPLMTTLKPGMVDAQLVSGELEPRMLQVHTPPVLAEQLLEM